MRRAVLRSPHTKTTHLRKWMAGVPTKIYRSLLAVDPMCGDPQAFTTVPPSDLPANRPSGSKLAGVLGMKLWIPLQDTTSWMVYT